MVAAAPPPRPRASVAFVFARSTARAAAPPDEAARKVVARLEDSVDPLEGLGGLGAHSGCVVPRGLAGGEAIEHAPCLLKQRGVVERIEHGGRRLCRRQLRLQVRLRVRPLLISLLLRMRMAALLLLLLDRRWR